MWNVLNTGAVGGSCLCESSSGSRKEKDGADPDVSEIEFWSGQPSRLHDRFRYTRSKEGESGEWAIDRLSP